ncbi:MAG: hypothetical protein RI907_3534 [Pseudomonadota bacterium]|jgi:O-antigen/teichoic acid export membrane protein
MSSVKFIAIGALAQQGLAMLVTVAVSRLLGVQGYGQLVTLVAVAGTLFSLTSQSSLPYLLRESSVRYAQDRVLGNEFYLPFLVSLTCLLAMVLAIPVVPDALLAGVHALPWLVTALAAVGYFLFQVAKAAFQVQQRFVSYSVVLCADKVLLLLGILVLVAVGWLTLPLAIWAQAASIILAGTLGVSMALQGALRQGGGFEWRSYAKSALPIAGSLLISNIASLPFLIIRGTGGASGVAWLGMANMALGILLQPFNWLAPTLAPKLSNDVRAEDASVKIRTYMDAQVQPLMLLALLMAILATLASAYTPLLGWIFGAEFQHAATAIGLTAFMAPAEVANMLVIQLVYAKAREGATVPAMLLKAAPFVIGLYANLPLGEMLVLLNVGTWLMMAVQLFSVRDCLNKVQLTRFAVMAMASTGMQLWLLHGSQASLLWGLILLAFGVALTLIPNAVAWRRRLAF